MHAGLARLAGDGTAATAERARAALGFDAADMRLLAAVARRGSPSAAPDRWFAEQRIADPARFAALFAPAD